MLDACIVSMLICPLLIFATLDANVEEEEGGDLVEAFEEEGQGHFASQGKPPSLMHTSDPIDLNALFYRFTKVHVLLSIVDRSDRVTLIF